MVSFTEVLSNGAPAGAAVYAAGPLARNNCCTRALSRYVDDLEWRTGRKSPPDRLRANDFDTLVTSHRSLPQLAQS